MYVSVVSILVNLVLNWTFVHVLGLRHVGLALSTSAVALGNCALLYAMLRRRVGPLGGGLTWTLGRIVLAAAVMGAVGVVGESLLGPRLPANGVARYALELAIGVPLCGAVFVLLARALGVPMPWERRRPSPTG
jgi:putative peptidoglycan lipid II flippase